MDNEVTKNNYIKLVNIEKAILDCYNKFINDKLENNIQNKNINYLKFLLDEEQKLLHYFISKKELLYIFNQISEDSDTLYINDIDYIINNDVNNNIINKRLLNKTLPVIIQSISDEHYEDLQNETDNEVINYFYLMDDDDYDEEVDLDCEYQYNPYEQLDIDTINSILLNQAICNNRNIETFDLLLFDRYIINNLFSMVIKKVEKINNQTINNKFKKEYINLQYKLMYINPIIEDDVVKNNFDFNKINSYDPYNKENYILLEVKYDDIKKYIDKLYEILISTAVSKLISTSDESKNLNDSFNYEVLTIVTDELLNKINYKKLIIFENKIVKAFNGAKNNQQYLKSVNNALSLIKKRTNKVKIVSKN